MYTYLYIIYDYNKICTVYIKIIYILHIIYNLI